MNKKLIGIFVCMLLIATAVLPALATMNELIQSYDSGE